MSVTTDIVAKLWNLCNVLRDDGVTYLQYVTELTYLLFLKMMQETDREEQLPVDYRWRDLVSKEGIELIIFYRELLLHLGTGAKSDLVREIFTNAQTAIKQPKNLRILVTSIDALDWYSAKSEGMGDLYEGLLAKNATEKKSGAGQYFTPRPLIDSIVALMEPKAGELIQDPAAGTGGFLIASDRYIKQHTSDLFELSESEQTFQKYLAFYGLELVQDAQRLLLMNMLLHGIEGTIRVGDTLSSEGTILPAADLILSNPPFGTKKGGGAPSRDDFTYETSNKQLAFVQHIYRNLKSGGRAAVVLPDNVLFEDNIGQRIRADLMDKCNLHTILRLPTGIFYAQGVKTNVLFFQKGVTPIGNTRHVWIYDLRSNGQNFGKRNQLNRSHFTEFEEAYRETPRIDRGEASRWRCFSREDIAKRGDNLDISWLKDESLESGEDLGMPDEIAIDILSKLKLATMEIEALQELLK